MSVNELYERYAKRKAWSIVRDNNHVLALHYKLLPSGRCFRIPKFKTRRLQNSFIPSSVLLWNKSSVPSPSSDCAGLFVEVCVCMCVCVCVRACVSACVCVYVYACVREREREFNCCMFHSKKKMYHGILYVDVFIDIYVFFNGHVRHNLILERDNKVI